MGIIDDNMWIVTAKLQLPRCRASKESTISTVWLAVVISTRLDNECVGSIITPTQKYDRLIVKIIMIMIVMIITIV